MKTLLRSLMIAMLAATSAAAQRDTAFTWSRRLPDGARLAIKNLSGPIDVRAGTTDRVEVRATIRVESRGNLSDITFDVREATADDVEICTIYRGVNACDPDTGSNDVHVSVRYIVNLPKGLRFRAFTGSGDIIIMQSAAEVDAQTGSGDIVIRESMSRVSASSGSGDVTVAMANGPVKVSSGNGKVLVNTARGPVDANTGNGDIDVRMATVTQGVDQPSMSVTSGNGSIRVTLPSDFSGEIDANTGSGSINTDFEMRVQGRLDNSRLRGAIGTGVGPVIKIRSGHGRVEIRKG
jgi:DUF4097 and DUF4098 domain-containing protein YvlB